MKQVIKNKLAIVGIKGLPAKYGGFETFVDQFCKNTDIDKKDISVYCDVETDLSETYDYCKRIKVPLLANGISSIFFDMCAMLHAAINKRDILLLGCSGALVIPICKLFRVKVVTNIAGLEWSRNKWGKFARFTLKFLEKLAIKYSDHIIADNSGISDYIKEEYGKKAKVIAYGGDHLPLEAFDNNELENLKIQYEIPFVVANSYIAVARCQSDNNIEEILLTFSHLKNKNIIFVSNWEVSDYGEKIRNQFKDFSNIALIGPIYDLRELTVLRMAAKAYIHGHSAGGTNPALVEAMWCGLTCYCFDNIFNRSTTHNQADYWHHQNELKRLIENENENENDMTEIAKSEYTWQHIVTEYKGVFNDK
jgi:hypothetical protein